MSEEGTKKGKKLLSRWDWLWLVVVFIILLGITLPKCGIHMIKTTEDSEVIDRPHDD